MNTPCYVGRKACGCYVAARVDDGTDPKETAKSLGEWIKSGLIIERKDTDFVRESLRSCQCKPVPVAEQPLPLFSAPAQ